MSDYELNELDSNDSGLSMDNLRSEEDDEIMSEQSITHPEIQSEDQAESESEDEDEGEFVKVKVLLTEPVTKIKMVVLATGKTESLPSTDHVRLSHGRAYYVPVNTDIDSDEATVIKVFGEQSKYFDVRFIKDGYAFILPLQHNKILRNNDLVCMVV